MLVPFGNAQRYDLVFDLGNKLYRVQCKTGRVRNGVIRFNACDNDRRSYVGQVEFLAICEPDSGQIYLLRPEETATQLGTLRVTKTKSGQKKGIRYAEDFLLDKILRDVA